jgi:hypothetical protein
METINNIDLLSTFNIEVIDTMHFDNNTLVHVSYEFQFPIELMN